MGYTFSSSPVLSNASGGLVINTPVEMRDAGGVGGRTLERELAAAIVAGVLTLDCSLGNAFVVSLSANITSVVFRHPPKDGAVQGITLIFVNDGTLRTVTWPASVQFPSGAVPALTGTLNKRDIVLLTTYDGGVVWAGAAAATNL